MKITVDLELNENTIKFLESEGYSIVAKKVEHPKILAPDEVSKDFQGREVTVRRLVKDLDITFGDQLEAEEWRNQFAVMLEQEGYHLSREKPESAQAADAASAINE